MLGKTMKVALLATVAMLALSAAAQARQVQPYHYSGELFEVGSSPAAIAFDGADDSVLVAGTEDIEEGLKVSKFHLDGATAPFTGLADEPASFRTGEELGADFPVAIAVDESGTASDGNFYVVSPSPSREGQVRGYAADGAALPGYPISIPGACGVAVAPDGHPWIASSNLGSYQELTSAGKLTGRGLFLPGAERGKCVIAFDSAGNLYLAKGERLAKYDASLHFVGDLGPYDPEGFSLRGSPLLAFDRGNDTLFELFDFTSDLVVQADPSGDPLVSFGGPDPTHFSYGGLGNFARDIAVDPQTHKVYVLRAGEVNVFAREPGLVATPDASTGGLDALSSTSATLTGTLDPAGLDTTDCRFEWGKGFGYGETAPCEQGNVFSGQSVVTATIGGLEKGVTYHYRLVGENASGTPGFGRDREFVPADPPLLSAEGARHITSDSAQINLAVNANGADGRFRVEVGTDSSYGMGFPVPDATVSSTKPGPQFEGTELVLTPQDKSVEIHGLGPATEYHYRVVAENAAGVTEGPDHVFRTFALPSVSDAGCPNKQARQQTSSGELLDCRGYELVSAPDTGGYDVRSGLSPEVDAIATSPDAADAVLYSMRSGTIPGVAGHPTNRGADPYLATRGANGWSTRYVGLASNNPFAGGPFASPLSGFDEALDAFSFGGNEICDPCFEDGSTDVPLRQGSSDMTQGMAGSVDPPGPANPAGIVKKPLSADGSHLVFESTAQFEPDANSNGTDVTIYSRDLKAGTTEVVSTDENGDVIQAGEDLAELDVSKDGSRTLFGEELATDAKGNRYYHLYLHVAGTKESVDLMPGATEGALYAGMSEDAAKVFFTTTEQLLPADTDESADAYEDEVHGPGTVTPQILSQGSGAGDTDSCSPPGDPDSWNVPSGKGKCDVLAFAGGAGVASQAGDFYFISPELLDGPANGTQDQANLYLVEGGTTTPHFVATIDSSLSKPPAQPPARPTLPGSFGGSHATPEGIAVDQSNGDVYVAEAGASRISRYTSAGAPDEFTEGPGEGTNRIGGFSFVESTAGVAVDNSGGSFDGDIYVTNNPKVSVYARSGKFLGELTGFVGEVCGVGLDQSDGSVYVGDCGGRLWRFLPTTPGASISNANYTVTGIATGFETAAVAADNGNVYAATWPNGPAFQYSASQFEAGFPSPPGTLLDSSANAISTDPLTHEVLVDEGSRISVFDPAGQKQLTIGEGEISGSRGVAISATTNHLYAANTFSSGGPVTEFGYEFTPYAPIDNPAILHATHQAGSHDSSDFQVTPDGHYAAFASLLPLDGYDSGGRYEVFRSEHGGTPECLSCAPTLAIPTSDATLTPYGQSLLADGRVFFTTGEQLTLRDTNEKRDAYEWSGGKQELISTGTSPSDSELLSASSDGKDVFFFARQKLVPGDENGDNVRLYDAREGGGFEFGPPTFQCAASDECHGASTKAAPPLGAATTAGTPGQFEEQVKSGKCGKGKVKRRGRCVRRKAHTQRPHKRNAHKRAAKANRGGGK